MKTPFLLGILLAVVLGVGYWLYTGPQRALGALKVAADANDQAAFRQLVDVPAMRAAMLAQLLGPPDPTSGPILVSGLSMLGLNQTATPRGLQSYLRDYQPPTLGLWGGQGGEGRYATASRYLFTTSPSSPGSPGSTLVLQRRGLAWQLITIEIPINTVNTVE
jgi:hypothetical protein